ncbi:SDR family NAD(P)-dependent oxidoreductase [Methylobacterium dankookense]|uniref:Oxidoreductase SadH n=1 Tax=Methylobacterium dankookense TaxID=560405 RepID=A0A564FWY4_9HYPH|nr:SDR family oxidoreductase [Methylobacterium dankookense]GJD56395.1 Putative oxidoreductase SadH [Methylobacterium dankookense]VUF12512.1 Putative oxidoreductase SadH [Methylobacterium dankookense]
MVQNFRFRGSVALVTGAASGIGAALVIALTARGCAVAMVDRDAAGLDAVAGIVEPHGVPVSKHVADLTDAEAIRALPRAVEAEFGRLNLLVNNAGVALGGRFADVHPDDVDWLLDINLRAVMRVTHAFLPMLAREPLAHVVNMSSLFGLIAPPGQAAYAASKFAVRGFSEALRHEYAGTGLGVTVVHPGGVDTPIARSARGPRPEGDAALVEATRLAFEKARSDFQSFLKLSPDFTARKVLDAVEQREARVVIGKDARYASLIQRVLPADYWKLIQRLSRAAN